MAEHNFCDKEGAELLAALIRGFWKRKGYDIQVDAREVGFHPAIRCARFDIRSDLRNGLPSKAYQEKLARAA